MKKSSGDKDISFREKFSYWFDNVMSKGTVSLVGLLFLITLAVVVISGILAALFGGGGCSAIGHNIWVSLMHAIDAGTITGHSGTFFYMFLMTLVTICGLFITSILIGLINSGVMQKMDSLRKGKSRVLEKGHTVILGMGGSIYTLLAELMEAGAAVIVIMDGSMEKEEMEDMIRQRIPDSGQTKIICRRGSITDFADLSVCSPEYAKSIIINTEDDFVTIKSILAVTNLLKKSSNNDTYITAIISDRENYEAALIAGEDRAEVLFFEDTIAEIAANTCRQPGLSSVYTELFSFCGSEIYMEDAAPAAGIRMRDINLYFHDSVVLGMEKKGNILLNPPADTQAEKGDRLIMLSAGTVAKRSPGIRAAADCSCIMPPDTVSEKKKQKMLILGYSPRLGKIIAEEDKYMAPGSEIFLAVQEEYREMLQDDPPGSYENISVSWNFCDIYSPRVLEELLSWQPGSVFVASSLMEDAQTDDSKTLLVLLQLRSIAGKMCMKHSVTSEMRSVENQALAQITEVKDFVISSNITSLMLTQISQTRELRKIFRELLSAEGSEIYMLPASDYVKTGVPVSIYTAGAAAALRNQVLIGYSIGSCESCNFSIVLNPEKSTELTFSSDDRLILLSQD